MPGCRIFRIWRVDLDIRRSIYRWRYRNEVHVADLRRRAGLDRGRAGAVLRRIDPAGASAEVDGTVSGRLPAAAWADGDQRPSTRRQTARDRRSVRRDARTTRRLLPGGRQGP